MKSEPNLYDQIVIVDGIKLVVDSMERRGTDNIMPMLWEEQPMTWHFVRGFAEKALTDSAGEIDFLDVGCGSGVFSLLMAKHLGAKTLGIDINPRAIEFSEENSRRNNITSAVFRLESYSPSTVPPKSTKVIGLYPPYHLYPPSVEGKIPLHARGGWNGQGVFEKQLKFAIQHVDDNGIIFAQQMLVGDSAEQCLLDALESTGTKRTFECVLTQILTPISSKKFLAEVYGKRYTEFHFNFAERYAQLFLVVAVMKATAQGVTTIEEVGHNFDLHGRSWGDRILAHKEIAGHETNIF